AIGVVYPSASTSLPPAISPSDCNQSLAELSGRLAHVAGAPEWVEAVRAHVTWRPWQLDLAIANAAGASRAGTQPPSLNGLVKLAQYSTANLRPMPPPGDSYRFDVALSFQKSTIIALVFASGQTRNPTPFLTPDSILSAEIASALPPANLVADAQYGFINDLLKIYAPVYQVPIQIQGLSQPLTVRNVRVSGGDDTITATGNLALGDVAYNGAVRCEGEDLSISQITLQPIASACDSGDLVERMQCQGQQAASGMSSNAIAQALSNYYQGQRFHYSTIDRPLLFNLGENQYRAKFEALKSSSHDSSFCEAGRVSIERVPR
ncbi:MAG: hypothetical protein JWM69_321, partial [Candidatus Binatus sp.]|nr:hypothetical protein [Candidatus Binatus sp.]